MFWVGCVFLCGWICPRQGAAGVVAFWVLPFGVLCSPTPAQNRPPTSLHPKRKKNIACRPQHTIIAARTPHCGAWVGKGGGVFGWRGHCGWCSSVVGVVGPAPLRLAAPGRPAPPAPRRLTALPAAPFAAHFAALFAAHFAAPLAALFAALGLEKPGKRVFGTILGPASLRLEPLHTRVGAQHLCQRETERAQSPGPDREWWGQGAVAAVAVWGMGWGGGGEPLGQGRLIWRAA